MVVEAEQDDLFRSKLQTNGQSKINPANLKVPEKEQCFSRQTCKQRGGVLLQEQKNVYELISRCVICKGSPGSCVQKKGCSSCQDGTCQKAVIVCPKGQTFSNGVCVPRPKLTVIQQPSCKPGERIVNGQCSPINPVFVACPRGY